MTRPQPTSDPDARVIELSVTDLADLVEKQYCPQLAQYVDAHTGPWAHTESPKLDALDEAADDTTPLIRHDADLFEMAVEQQFDALNWQTSKPMETADARQWLQQQVAEVAETGDVVAVAQLDLETIEPIGRFALSGRPDLLVVVATDTSVHIHICDMEATWDESPKYQLQTALYGLILQQWFDQAQNANPVEFSSVIISKETALNQALTLATLDAEATDMRPLWTFFRMVLASDGRLDRLYRSLDPEQPTAVQFEHSKCMNCRLTSACHGKLVEDRSTGLLGWPVATQRRVAREHGYRTLEEIASEADDSTALPFTLHDGVLPDSLQRLRSEIDESPRRVLSRANSLLSGINPSHPAGVDRHPDDTVPRRPGGGYGTLSREPDDRHLRLNFYLHVTHDHRFDRLCLLSGCRLVGREGMPVSELEPIPSESVATIPYPRTEPSKLVDLLDRLRAAQTTYTHFEREMLTSFAEGLFDRMSADHIVHLYLYTEREREALLDACRRHRNSSDAIAALHDMLVLNPDVCRDRDAQPMVSIIHRAVKTQMQLPWVNSGLIPTADHVADTHARAADAVPIPTDWTYRRGQQTVNLRQVFSHRLFAYTVDFRNGEIQPDRPVDPTAPLAHGYPTRLRGASIPLDYIYGLTEIGPLTAQWPLTSNQATQPPAEYLFHDADRRTNRITRNEIYALAQRLAREAARVERACPDRTFLDKTPLEVSKPEDFRIRGGD
ncbi:PD-(D/E)XK nuclease family protein [Natrialbaceae archaeon GCM10025810]|uniref:PD-(D/E)XK nuclease family protein n=1 Tax=Halovalidus salilacus TaxID=3075124 RepID=UPI0036215707